MTAARVRIPPVLRIATGGAREVPGRGETIRQVLDDLARTSPALALHLFDEAGAIRRHIICIHDGALVRAAEMATHKIKAGDEIILANAFAGG